MTKIGFSFSGEGARGAIQAGIVKSLDKQGIRPEVVVGTSSGASCAFGYSVAGADALASMWSKTKNIFSFFGINWGALWGTGLLKQGPMEKKLRELMAMGEKNGYDCQFARCILSYMDIRSGELTYVDSDEYSKEGMMESTLRAVAVTAMVKDRQGYVDAGSREMTPLKQAIKAGCDTIYIILGRPLQWPQWTIPRGMLGFVSMAYRALDISLYEILVRDIEECIRRNAFEWYNKIDLHIIQPKALLYDSIEFYRCVDGVKYAENPENWQEISGHDALLALIEKSKNPILTFEAPSL